MSSNVVENSVVQKVDFKETPETRTYRLAGAAFDLIEQHSTPPAPTTYSLWYAYAARSPEVVKQEVDSILEEGGAISADQIEDIYDAHLSRSPLQETGERVGQAIEASLSEVSEMISKTSSETRAMKAKLDGVGSNIPSRPKRRDVVAIFEKLMETNAQMSDMTENLAGELTKSQDQVRQLNEEFQEIKKQSRTDALTDVANRRAFNERLDCIHDNAMKTGEPYALALIDLDKFKQINDCYGHPTGDLVLTHLAALMVKNIETSDFAARIGGDEFAIIFPGQTALDAYSSLIAIKLQLENLNISEELNRNSRHQVTFSCGVSEFSKNRSLEELMEAADKELLKAKGISRNHICVEGRRV